MPRRIRLLRRAASGADIEQVEASAATRAVRRNPLRARRRPSVSSILVTADVIMLTGASALAVAIAGHGAHQLGWAAGYALAAFLGLRIRGFYAFRLDGSIVTEVARILAATAFAAMLLMCARVLAGQTSSAPEVSVRLWVYSGVFLAASRAGIALEARRLWRQGRGLRPTLIIGTGQVARLIASRLRDRPGVGLSAVGHLDDKPLPVTDGELPTLGGTADLERVIYERKVSHVIIGFSLTSDAYMKGLMSRCRAIGVEVLVVPRLYEEMTHRLTIDHLGGIPLIRVEQPNPRGWQFAVKYTIDRVVAASVLLILAPLLAVIAVATLLSLGRPILFRQKRLGRDGREFTMLKFRTMRGDPAAVGEADADWAAAMRGTQQAASGREEVVAGRETAQRAADRTTRVGTALRACALDELPQLFNVLSGDMSLIGPRPERVGYARQFEGAVYRYTDRHRVKSGITGWAQVNRLRGETSLADRVEWDNFYIENWSLGLDAKIVLMTVPALLGGMWRGRTRKPHRDRVASG